jgi:hypothetical protein
MLTTPLVLRGIVLLSLIIIASQTAWAFYEPSLGRWINRDPIQESGGLNLYQFVRNRPVLILDAFGLKPGDKYPSADDAAKAAMGDICKKCKDTGAEWGGISI